MKNFLDQMGPGAWRDILPPLLILIGVIAAALYSGWKRRRGMTPREEQKILANSEVTVQQVGDVEYRVVCQPAGRSGHSFVSVNRTLPSPGRFQVKRREDTDFRINWEWAMGLGFQPKTSDADFEQRFRVTTVDVEFTRAFLQSPQRREAIRALLDNGFDAVVLDGPREDKLILATAALKSPISPDALPAMSSFAISQLQQMEMGDNPPLPAPKRILGVASWKLVRWVSQIIPVLVFLCLFPELYLVFGSHPTLRLSDHAALMGSSWIWGLAVGGVFAAIMIPMLRGRTGALVNASRIAVLSLVAFCVSSFTVPELANRFLDTAPSTHHNVPVLDRRITLIGKTRKFRIIVPSWRSDRETESIDLSSSEWKRAEIGETVTICTKPGWLGKEWIVSYSLGGRTGG